MTVTAREIIDRCQHIARFSESSSGTTRTFLCPAMHDVHRYLGAWMESLGMMVTIDAMGNLRAVYAGTDSRRLLIGSHLDTVPNAGAYDGVLGVVLAIALVQSLAGKSLPFTIEIIGFSEEEGVRFSMPFLGSRALIGRVDDQLLCVMDPHGISVADAIRNFSLDPNDIGSALLHPNSFAYLEFHIEQGPLLDNSQQPLGVVTAIAGQSRYLITFTGAANHAGTTPMHLRRDALAGAAEWIRAVETEAQSTPQLVATVAAIQSEPAAGNVVPGRVTASLDIRHSSDETRRRSASKLLEQAQAMAARRGLVFHAEPRLDQCAVSMDTALVGIAAKAGCAPALMVSGAGHDAMILAEKVPAVMFFLRSPGGISHHPDESVRTEDVAAALSAGMEFLAGIAQRVSC